MKTTKSKNTSTKRPKAIQEQKKSKSKKNKKDWIKNIDVTKEEKKRIKKLDSEIKEKRLVDTKNEDLFQEDKTPVEIPRGFLKRKTRRSPLKNTEVNKIKRKVKAYEYKNEVKEESKLVTNDTNIDLWADTEKENKLSIRPVIQFPKVPIAHPGQSYNPSKKDLKSLITNIVEINTKGKTMNDHEKQVESNEVNQTNIFLNDDDSEHSSEIKENKDTVASKTKTRISKSKELQKKLNKLKNQKDLIKKKTKVEIDRLISGNRFEKIQKENALKLEKENRRKKNEEEQQNRLTQIGITKE